MNTTFVSNLSRSLASSHSRRSAFGAFAAIAGATLAHIRDAEATDGVVVTVNCSASLDANISSVCDGLTTINKGRRKKRKSKRKAFHGHRRRVTRVRKRPTTDVVTTHEECVTRVQELFNGTCEVTSSPPPPSGGTCGQTFSSNVSCAPVGSSGHQDTGECCTNTFGSAGTCAYGQQNGGKGQRCKNQSDCEPLGLCCRQDASSRILYGDHYGYCINPAVN